MTLQPGWADAYALAVKEHEPEKVTGAKPKRNITIDWARRRESAVRGGRKGGKNKKGHRKDKT